MIVFLVVGPVTAAGIAAMARQTGQTGRIVRASGPLVGSPNRAVPEAFIVYAEANHVHN